MNSEEQVPDPDEVTPEELSNIIQNRIDQLRMRKADAKLSLEFAEDLPPSDPSRTQLVGQAKREVEMIGEALEKHRAKLAKVQGSSEPNRAQRRGAAKAQKTKGRPSRAPKGKPLAAVPDTEE